MVLKWYHEPFFKPLEPSPSTQNDVKCQVRSYQTPTVVGARSSNDCYHAAQHVSEMCPWLHCCAVAWGTYTPYLHLNSEKPGCTLLRVAHAVISSRFFLPRHFFFAAEVPKELKTQRSIMNDIAARRRLMSGRFLG